MTRAMATTGPYRVIIGYNSIDKDSEGCLLGHYSGHQNAKAAAYRKGAKVPVYWWRVEEQTEPDKEWKVRERWQKHAPTQKEIDAAEAKRLGKQLSGLNCIKCGRPLYYVKPGEVEMACSRCGHDGAPGGAGARGGGVSPTPAIVTGTTGRLTEIVPSVSLDFLAELAEEITKWNAKVTDGTADEEEQQVGQWVLAGMKPDGKNCKHCLALHGKEMTYGEFLDKHYTTNCGGSCRCDFKLGNTVKPQTDEELKAILEQVGQWVLADIEPDSGNCEDCLALHGTTMTYEKYLDMKHEMTSGGDECQSDFKPGTTVKRLTQEEFKAALEE